MLLAFLLIGPVLFLCLSALHWRRKAFQKAKEAQGMALLASNLEGQLAQSEDKANRMTEIARDALKIAAEKHFPAPRGYRPGEETQRIWDDAKETFASQFVAPVVAHCSSCNVSVRHKPSEYPVHCPACQTLIDPTLDSPPEL